MKFLPKKPNSNSTPWPYLCSFFSTGVQSVIAKGTKKNFECDCGEIHKSKGREEHVTHHGIERNPEPPIQGPRKGL